MFDSIFSQIRIIFEPVQGPCTINVGNEPLHVMACVVKRETPPNGIGYFVTFNMEKAYQF